MPQGTTKFELILLFDRLGLEPKKMDAFLDSKGQAYSIHTLRKYYNYYATAKMITDSILRK